MRAAIRIFACLGLAATVGGCLDETGVYCEVFDYNGQRTVLAVPKEYYALPRVDDKSGISLYFRYSDFKPKAGREDFAELANPAWSLATSNLTALLGIERHRLSWPASLDDLIARGHKNASEVPSDWDGWQKIEQCANCSERLYFSGPWRARGVTSIGCYEVKGRDPIYMGCSAKDTIDGLLVTYSFPVTKKQHFEEFRARTTEFIRKLATDAKTRCTDQ